MKINECTNLLLNKMSTLFKWIAIKLYTLLVMIDAHLRGNDVGKKCRFNGLVKFYRFTPSNIKIGYGCIFNSRHTSNLIGVNHKCIISTLSSQASLVIGDNCGFSGTTIGCFSSITIGNDVRVGANVLITDSDWHLDDPRSGSSCPIVNNVWIGYGAIIKKGVTIGENSVIGMNSVVTKDIPANVVAAGTPCRVIKNI